MSLEGFQGLDSLPSTYSPPKGVSEVCDSIVRRLGYDLIRVDQVDQVYINGGAGTGAAELLWRLWRLSRLWSIYSSKHDAEQ